MSWLLHHCGADDVSVLPTFFLELAQKSPPLHTDGFLHLSAWGCSLTWVHLWPMCRVVQKYWGINIPGATFNKLEIGVNKYSIDSPHSGITVRCVPSNLSEGLQYNGASVTHSSHQLNPTPLLVFLPHLAMLLPPSTSWSHLLHKLLAPRFLSPIPSLVLCLLSFFLHFLHIIFQLLKYILPS